MEDTMNITKVIALLKLVAPLMGTNAKELDIVLAILQLLTDDTAAK
jgi:hypothetical protein